MADLRKFTSDMPVGSPMVTVILIPKKGVPTYYQNKTDKRSLITKYGKGDRLIAVWTGQWKSDAFEIGIEDLVSV